MPGTSLTRTIVLNGRVGTGFDAIGNTLLTMGAQLDGVSQKIINFGKDSIETYKDYEYNMAQAMIAQTTKYGQGTAELETAMKELDKYASEWSATTIFHTKDVSNAIMLASRNGMDAKEIIATFPSIMQLAQAGGIDLSEALDMTLRSMRALGYEMTDPTVVNEFVDMWAFAANSSAGSVESFGEAMLKLGAVMRFTDTKEELFSLLALMHNMGVNGSEAATMLRTSIIRLVAPSGVTTRVLKKLGATQEELKDVMENKTMKEAWTWLDQHGFSPFEKHVDEMGNTTTEMKPVLTMFQELGAILATYAGSYDAIMSNETTVGVLGAIFGTRGIVGATNIMNEMDFALSLMKSLQEGASEGYGAYGQNIMMDTLYGSTMKLESKLEELERKTGETLSPTVRSVQEAIGGIVDSVNSLDKSSFEALVSGFGTIALAASSMTAIGMAFSLLSNIITPAGGIAVTVAGLAAIVATLHELDEAQFENAFGTGELDEAAVMSYVQQISADFTSAYTEIEKFRASINQAKLSYQEASASFSTSLMTAVLTGITPDQQASLEKMGVDMYKYVVSGISDAQNASMAYWEMFFNGQEGTDWSIVQELIGSGYEDMLQEAAAVNNRIKSALMSGFENGFTEDDYAIILDYMNEYNALVARAAAEAEEKKNYARAQTTLKKAQTASYDELDSLSKDMAAERDRVLKEADSNFWTEYYELEWTWNKAIESGKTINGVEATAESRDAFLAQRKSEYDEKRLAMMASYDQMIQSLWLSGIRSSQFANEYNEISQLIEQVYSGAKDIEDAYQQYNYMDFAGLVPRGVNTQNLRNLNKTINKAKELIGTDTEISDLILSYWRSGDTESGDALLKMMLMNKFAGANLLGDRVTMSDPFGSASDYGSMRYLLGYRQVQQAYEAGGYDYNPELKAEVETYLNTDAVDEYMPPEFFTYLTIMPRTEGFEGGDGGGHGFASGGRATTASIFGEAGPEWAIPEAHTERTAALLNAAREASGFTWPDLLSRFGGLNGNASHTPTNVVYSPIINANDVTGVRQALSDDKRRLERWLEDRRRREEATVYA